MTPSASSDNLPIYRALSGITQTQAIKKAFWETEGSDKATANLQALIDKVLSFQTIYKDFAQREVEELLKHLSSMQNIYHSEAPLLSKIVPIYTAGTPEEKQKANTLIKKIEEAYEGTTKALETLRKLKPLRPASISQ